MSGIELITGNRLLDQTQISERKDEMLDHTNAKLNEIDENHPQTQGPLENVNIDTDLVTELKQSMKVK